MCAENGNIDLLDGDLKSAGSAGSSYYFVVDTCESIANAIGSSTEGCKTNQESLDVMNVIAIDWKLSNAFFSADTYVSKGDNFSYSCLKHTSELSQHISSR